MNFLEAKNRVTEHYREVIELLMGRKLKTEEVVHHIDGNPLNNSPNNLMVFPNSKEHTQYHYHKEREELIKSGKYKYLNQKMADYYKENQQRVLRRDLMKRMRQMNGVLTCKICSRTGFTNNKSLSNHIRWHKGFHRAMQGGD